MSLKQEHSKVFSHVVEFLSTRSLLNFRSCNKWCLAIFKKQKTQLKECKDNILVECRMVFDIMEDLVPCPKLNMEYMTPEENRVAVGTFKEAWLGQGHFNFVECRPYNIEDVCSAFVTFISDMNVMTDDEFSSLHDEWIQQLQSLILSTEKTTLSHGNDFNLFLTCS